MTPPDAAAAVRAALARAAFGLPHTPLPTHVGPLPLRPHQQAAVARLRQALATHRGALLADAVGLGKTRVALALAAEFAAPLVVAPAALRAMWQHAAASAGVSVGFASTEALSAQGAPCLTPADLVVVDEAHHFRTPGTRRRARLAGAAAAAGVLLLTATPVHNAARDLTALLALFLGDTAGALDAATLAHLVVRRRRRDINTAHAADARPPRVRRTAWHQVATDRGVLDALVGIPPPLPAVDAGHAPALATLTHVRLWTSSDAAARAALRRRLARAAALAHTLAAGHHPTRRDLAAWTAGDAAVQLPLLFDDARAPNAADLVRAVDAHAAALRRALTALDAAPPADPARLAWLCDVRARHPGARVVAFTQFADTARAVFRALAPAGHVGLLTAAGGRIASGPLPRDALLARFAPRATGAPDPPAIERIDVLISTDCLSEGLDLRDASVVAHLDVPWTPARLAQRVGRAARLGSDRGEVHVYGLKPPRPAERWLRLARRLRAKTRAGRTALGEAQRSPAGRALARHLAVHRRLERWLLAAPPALPSAPAVAPGARPRSRRPPLSRVPAVRCGHPGFVAVWQPHGPAPPVLLAALSDRPLTAAPATVARALRYVAHANAVVLPGEATTPVAVDRAHAAVHAWAARRAARTAVGHLAAPALDTARPPGVNAACTALARADAALRAAPPHARAAQATAAAQLRAQLAGPASNPGGHITALVLLRA